MVLGDFVVQGLWWFHRRRHGGGGTNGVNWKEELQGRNEMYKEKESRGNLAAKS